MINLDNGPFRIFCLLVLCAFVLCCCCCCCCRRCRCRLFLVCFIHVSHRTIMKCHYNHIPYYNITLPNLQTFAHFMMDTMFGLYNLFIFYILQKKNVIKANKIFNMHGVLAFLIKICPLSVVVVGVGVGVVVVVNLFHFHLLFMNHWVHFNQTWHKASFGEGDPSLFK